MVAYLLEYNRYLNLIGIAVIFGICWLLSKKRSAINLRVILSAFALQWLIAIVALRTSVGNSVLKWLTDGVVSISAYVETGSRFLFGNLIDPTQSWGFVFAFKVLPITIFFSALMAILFHYRIIQSIMIGLNFLLQPIFKTSGAETLCTIANGFLGQTEAPLLIRHYLARMTTSEILTVMISGMGTISGAVLIAYSEMGVPTAHLLAASAMGIPSTLLIAKILYPETHEPETKGKLPKEKESAYSSIFDAISRGTFEGLQIALAIGAILISFIALIAMGNGLLGVVCKTINSVFVLFGSSWQFPICSIEMLFGYLFAPFGFLLGFTGVDAIMAGQLLGIKVVANEMIAYREMITEVMSERTMAIITYALCGFANLSSIGIQMGGLSPLLGEKRKVIVEFGMYAVIGGTLANLLSAMIAGLLL